MKITTTHETRLTPGELAKALAGASPAEFAAFWFAFYEHTKGVSMLPWAESMAQETGSNRRRPLEKLVQLISYVEMERALRTEKADSNGL